MGILEDAIYNAKTAAGFVGKKAGKIVDVSKLTITAAELNSEISKKCEILGRVFYESKTTEKSYDTAISELIEKISELRGQLDSVNELIAESKNKTKCPKCSMVNSKEAIFCAKCGERLRNTEDIYEPDEIKDENSEESADVNAQIDTEADNSEAPASPEE